MGISPKVTLTDGNQMPLIGFGSYMRNPSPGKFKVPVEWAIEAGYRHVDTASSYHNEEEVGEAINNAITKGFVNRQDLFVTTKLWNDHHAEEDVVTALKESLRKLNLEYIDLYLIHWPVSVKNNIDQGIDYVDTWRGMVKCVQLGLAKSIGVSNFNRDQLARLLDNSHVKPSVHQFEINPTLTQEDLVEYCKVQNIVPVAYTPLGLISEARPEFTGLDVIKTDEKLGEISNKYGKSRPQVALRYLIQRGIVVIPKSFTKSRIEENLNIFDFELTNKEMDVVASYNINHRCVPATGFSKLKYYPF